MQKTTREKNSKPRIYTTLLQSNKAPRKWEEDDEMGWARSTNGKDKQYTQGFGGEGRVDISPETWPQIGEG
jgi:hypothetical protein